MLNLVIFGAPGSGKGTQSELIAKKYNLVHLSTGDLLRKEIAEQTELGKLAKGIIDQGKLVSDDVIINLLESNIATYPNANGFIFDGFPRTVVQAEELDSMLKKRNIRVSVMVNIDVDSDELVKRLLLRGQISGRTDDNMETIKKRIQTYEDQTIPVIQFYHKQGKHVKIQGIGTIDEIFERVSTAIDAVK